jgi:hypothetical protein
MLLSRGGRNDRKQQGLLSCRLIPTSPFRFLQIKTKSQLILSQFLYKIFFFLKNLKLTSHVFLLRSCQNLGPIVGSLF